MQEIQNLTSVVAGGGDETARVIAVIMDEVQS